MYLYLICNLPKIVYNIFFSFIIKIFDIFYCDKCNVIKNNNFGFIEKNIKIVSYNIDNLFIHSNQNKNKLLYKDINNLLCNKDFNIICLQEVWNTTFKNKILEMSIKKGWNYAIPDTNKKYFIGENSGLIFLSKYQIIQQKTHIYKHTRGMCSLSNKCAQFIKIKMDKDKYLNIVNTHLQSSHLNHYQDFRKTTLKQIEEIINNSPEKDNIIIGDLNLDYSYLKHNLNKNINFFNKYYEMITFPETGEHLDHCIYMGEKYNFKMKMKILNIHNSDHLPIYVKIET